MKNSDKKDMQKWVDTWKRAGSALKEVKRCELQNFDYAKNRKIVDEMLQFGYENRKVRLTSGLVEQQRIFMKMRDTQKQLSENGNCKGIHEFIISGRPGTSAIS